VTRDAADDEPDITLDDVTEVSPLMVEEILDEDESGPTQALSVAAVGFSEQGRRRKSNEDCLLVVPDGQLFAVADGIGDRAGGELASEMAIDVLRRALLKGPIEGQADVMRPRRADELVRAFEMANRAIYRRGQHDEDFRGMGTTLTALCTSAQRGRVYLAHVGDSRCYRLRGGQLARLTHDHTRGEMFGVGPLSSQLTRAIGIEPTVEIDLVVGEAAAGDLYLLCTDGLTNSVDENTIAAVASMADGLTQRACHLVERANQASGKDNISVVLIAVQPQS
jgi:PPM family protein phosphatase